MFIGEPVIILDDLPEPYSYCPSINYYLEDDLGYSGSAIFTYDDINKVVTLETFDNDDVGIY